MLQNAIFIRSPGKSDFPMLLSTRDASAALLKMQCGLSAYMIVTIKENEEDGESKKQEETFPF